MTIAVRSTTRTPAIGPERLGSAITASKRRWRPDSEVRSGPWRARANFGIDQDTSKSMFLVCFMDLEFAPAHDRRSRELQTSTLASLTDLLARGHTYFRL